MIDVVPFSSVSIAHGSGNQSWEGKPFFHLDFAYNFPVPLVCVIL